MISANKPQDVFFKKISLFILLYLILAYIKLIF